jgi:steroid delta-isomerase-like uncharacterized protein
MGQARDVMDRISEALFTGDLEALKALYAPTAVLETAGQDVIRGPDQIAAYMAELRAAFPDVSWEELHKHETGDTAIDEGYVAGTNTGPMTGPDGGTIPATGKRLRARECDVATVENGVVTSHRIYFDMLDWLAQLGLAQEPDA